MSKNKPAVILSHGPGGLGAVRSLARRDVPVTAIAFDADDPVMHSRFPKNKIALTATDDDKEAELLEILLGLPLDGAAILTTSDRTVTFVSNNQEALEQKYRFKIPSTGLLEALNDKCQETELVRRLGFAIPETVIKLPHDPETLAEQLRFPIIFKPHVFSVQDVFPAKNAVVSNREELAEFYEEWRHALHVLLAQEVIPGPDTASWVCSCTFDKRHRMLDCGIKQKLRSLPAHFGGSTHAVSKANSQILALAADLGERLQYVGHAGIEYRWDRRDNKYKYIELNPRLPANVGFDEASGMPTVWNSYKVALDIDVDSETSHVQDDLVYYLDFKGDFFSLRADGSSRLRCLLTLMGILLTRRTSGPYFAWDDPMPGIVVASRFVKKLLKRRRNEPQDTGSPQAQEA